MSIFIDGLVAFFAAVGLTALLWVLADLLLRRKEPSYHAAIVLWVDGSAEELDYAVWAACTARSQLGRYTPVLIVNGGLDEETLHRARELEENNNCVTVLSPSQIESYFKR